MQTAVDYSFRSSDAFVLPGLKRPCAGGCTTNLARDHLSRRASLPTVLQLLWRRCFFSSVRVSANPPPTPLLPSTGSATPDAASALADTDDLGPAAGTEMSIPNASTGCFAYFVGEQRARAGVHRHNRMCVCFFLLRATARSCRHFFDVFLFLSSLYPLGFPQETSTPPRNLFDVFLFLSSRYFSGGVEVSWSSQGRHELVVLHRP